MIREEGREGREGGRRGKKGEEGEGREIVYRVLIVIVGALYERGRGLVMGKDSSLYA